MKIHQPLKQGFLDFKIVFQKMDKTGLLLSKPYRKLTS